LTRRLVDASQEVIVREEDCGTQESILITRDEAKTRNEGFDELIFGRCVAEDVKDSKGNLILEKDGLVTKIKRDAIFESDVEMIRLRSPLTCRTTSGVCQKCFGMDLSTRADVDMGAPV
jgi:DNA-directed RNA polymerase subunit beta'